MTEFEQRAYIKIRTALNETPASIHFDLMNVYGNSAYSLVTIRRWVARFKAGQSELEDQPRSGRPITETSKANIDLIESLIDTNPRISYSYLEEFTSLSRGTLMRIIKDQLNMVKRSSRWIPHHLTSQNKIKRVEFAKAMLSKLNSEEWRLDQILTGDESIFYHRKIEKRAIASSWKRQGEPPDTIVKRDRFEAKSMVSIFFRTTGPVHVHLVEKGVTIDNQYYIENCLSPAFEAVKKERRASGLRGMKLLHDGAKPHVHLNTRNFIQSSGIIEIDHPPYSPDLAPSDYWLFDYIKRNLDDQESDEALLRSITKIVKAIPHSEYIKTFQKYKERLELCILADGDYFEHYMK
jgi:histone-lysine N-methyltransferase SETMAR